jgi:hypothetical protein
MLIDFSANIFRRIFPKTGLKQALENLEKAKNQKIF